MPLVLVFALLLLAGCTTFNINAPQPNLQTLNGGQSSCTFDCHTTQTATQNIGDGEGDVVGSTVTTTRSTQKDRNAPIISATP